MQGGERVGVGWKRGSGRSGGKIRWCNMGCSFVCSFARGVRMEAGRGGGEVMDCSLECVGVVSQDVVASVLSCGCQQHLWPAGAGYHVYRVHEV